MIKSLKMHEHLYLKSVSSHCQAHLLDILLAKGNNLNDLMVEPGNTKGGSITVPLTSCFTGLD
jgi:hypothetical protein